MADAPEPGCPACGARFRGTRECSRCGADLGALMTLRTRAWQMREQARLALLSGDPAQALASAREAQGLCSTPRGRRLELVALALHLIR